MSCLARTHRSTGCSEDGLRRSAEHHGIESRNTPATRRKGEDMSNSYDLHSKTVIVTGAARGIGRAITELLLASGAAVRIWDANPARISGASSDVVDITDSAAIEAALSGLPNTETPDILINNAGYLGTTQAFVEHPSEDWQRILAVNLEGTMRVTQAVLPRMLRAGGGRIVNMGSLAGKEGLATLAAYSAASAGVIAFTKALSRELAGRNIFVNCVAPGPIDTDMIRDLGSDVVDTMIAESPIKRLGSASEVAQLVAWLCTDASRFNTGAVFDMSGGRARY
jgi:2-dehydro-3-deoxy-L-rhamnonate dehydrogenase (NAD+)